MNQILARLEPLIHELQELPDWPMTEIPTGLLLYDVLVALRTPRARLEQILGQETLVMVEGARLRDAEQIPSP